jgi:prepilin-type N-terminal cleavage/methylation domain-containing protein
MNRLSNKSGFSLVEVILSSAIMLIGLLAVTSMLSKQQSEVKSLSQKFIILDIENLLLRTFMDGKVCKYLLADTSYSSSNPQTFDQSQIGTANPPVINLPQIVSGTLSSYTSGPFIVKTGEKFNNNEPDSVIASIRVANFKAYSAQSYFADIEVSLGNSKLIRALRPARVSITIQTDNSSPRKILSCAYSSSSVPYTISTVAGADLGEHTFCALQKVQNGWNTSIGNASIGVYPHPTNLGHWILSGTTDPNMSGAICVDF